MSRITTAIILLIVLFIFATLMPQFGWGTDAASALDEYTRFFPGNALPDDLDCATSQNHYEEYRTYCHTEGGAHCAFGQIVADRDVIVQTSYYLCHFPIAYLTAEYGHYDNTRRLQQSLLVRWPFVYAHVATSGWLDAMETAQTVTWWRRVETGTMGL